MKKKCGRCKLRKVRNEFGKDKYRLDGLKCQCNSCVKIISHKYRNSDYGKTKIKEYRKSDAHKASAKKYQRSEYGKIRTIYERQKNSSIRRNHPPPSYTVDDLSNWLYENGFKELWSNWKDCGYKTSQAPSVDRKDRKKPYTLDNIQLMTWCENETKAHVEISKPVIAISLNGDSPNVMFSSIVQAGTFIHDINKRTSTHSARSTISKACSGKIKYAYGFKWYYLIDINLKVE